MHQLEGILAHIFVESSTDNGDFLEDKETDEKGSKHFPLFSPDLISVEEVGQHLDLPNGVLGSVNSVKDRENHCRSKNTVANILSVLERGNYNQKQPGYQGYQINW